MAIVTYLESKIMMHLSLNIDLLKWIDQHRADKSRAAFIVLKLKEVMQNTASNDAIHTKGQNELHIIHGASDAPEQD